MPPIQRGLVLAKTTTLIRFGIATQSTPLTINSIKRLPILRFPPLTWMNWDLMRLTEEYKVFDIVYFEGNYEEVFDKYFGMWDMPATRNGMMSGYTSWYNYFQKIDENIIFTIPMPYDEVINKYVNY